MDYAVLIIHANDSLLFDENGYGEISKSMVQNSGSGRINLRMFLKLGLTPREAVRSAVSSHVRRCFGEEFASRGREENFQYVRYFPHGLARGIPHQIVAAHERKRQT